MTIKREGELKYTQRGFQMDAQEAMKGDTLRALVELITNADDAYNGVGNGSIEITCVRSTDPFKVKFSVRDKAGGLEGELMQKAFTNLGEENEKAVASMGTRGLFGRGAKDIASLGRARFISIRNGKYSTLEINHRGQFFMDSFDDSPNKDAYEETGLAAEESGLTAELYVHERHRVPSAIEMIEKLEGHVQLRSLINRNEVIYIDERNGTKKRLFGLEPTGEMLLDIAIPVPKYIDPVRLTLYRLPSKEVGPIDPYSRHGLVISGKGASYENTMLHLTSRPEVGWFCGQIDAPEVHDLSRAIDKAGGESAENPFRVISRNREGLVRDHPYWRALCAAIEPHLKPMLDAAAIEEGAQRKEGEKLRNKFNAVSNAIANKLQELLDASEAGEIPTETTTDDNFRDLCIIPPRRIMKKGETVSLTIQAPLDFDTSQINVRLGEPGGPIEIVAVPDGSNWIKHARHPVVCNTIRIKALAVGSCKIIASRDEVTATSEISVVDYELPEEVIPEFLCFDPLVVSMAPQKRKILVLRAPLSFAGERVAIKGDDDLLQVQSEVILKPNSSGTMCDAKIIAIAGESEGEVVVTGEVGSATASVKVRISESGQKRNPKLDFQLDGRDNPPRRVDAVNEDSRLVIRLYGKHRSLKSIFGNWSSAGFENENSPEASATISEILAQQLAVYVVEREAEMHPERFSDAAMYFSRQQMLVPHFVVALQAGLVNR